ILFNWRAHMIIPSSNGVRGSIVRYQPMYAHKIKTVLNGVSVPPQKPTRLEPARFTALAVGSLRWEKGFDILLDAFAQFIATTRVDAELRIAGKGILEEGLKSKVRALHLEKNVRFLGQLEHNEVLMMYRTVHCFVLSSVSEGNPTVVMEALAQGTPV